MRILEMPLHLEKEAMQSIYGDCNWTDDLNGNTYTDVHALILTSEEHLRIVEAQAHIVKLLHKVQHIISYRPELNEWLGIPENVISILGSEIETLTTYGRFDWVFDKANDLNVLEFNAETPMGWKEAHEYTRRAHQYYSEYRTENKMIMKMLEDSIRKTLEAYGDIGRGRIAVVGDLDDIEEQETFTMLADITRKVNPEVMLCNVTDLKVLSGYEDIEDGVYLERGEDMFPIDVLQTFYSIEWLAEDEGGQKLVELIQDNKIKLMNPASTLQIHSKGIWALIWSLLLETDLLKEEKDIIWAYIPYSTFDPQEFKELKNSKYVKKPLSHREGDGVEIKSINDVDKDIMDAEESEELFVFQEFIDMEPLSFPRKNGVLRSNKNVYTTIGAYCIEDKFAGYMSRVSEGVCSAYDATFVPTFIEEVNL